MIYLIDAPALHLCKVGYAVSPDSRVKGGAAFIPSPVRIDSVREGSRLLEAEVHRRCAHLREHGEWFRNIDEVRTHFIEAELSEDVAAREPASICTKAIEEAGGPVKLAAALGNLTPQAISQWKRIPAERVIAVEGISGISRHELRPDIFGPTPSEQGVTA